MSNILSRYKNILNIAMIRAVIALISVANIYVVSVAFSLEQLGIYSIFLAVSGYITQFGSFGFNQFALREIAADSSESSRIRFLSNQLVFLLCIFPLSLALVGVLGLFDFMIDQDLILLSSYVFFCILNNAMENFLVSSGAPIRAALGAAYRAAWVLVFFLLTTMELAKDEVFLAVLTMVFFEVTYLVANFIQLAKYIKLFNSWDKKWILSGAVVGSKYVMIGLFVLVSISIQRLFLYQYMGEKEAGVFYYFFMLFAFSPNFFEVVFFSVLLPVLVRNEGVTLFKQAVLGFCFVLILSVLLYLLLPLLLPYLGKDYLIDYYELAAMFLIYAPIYIVFRIMFNNFYANGRDREIITAVVLAVVISIFSSYVFIGKMGLGLLGGVASLYLVVISFVCCFGVYGYYSKDIRG